VQLQELLNEVVRHLKPANYLATVSLVIAALSCHPAAFCQGFPGVLTWHNDNARTGQNQQETVLTPANVNSKQFGKVFSHPIRGQAYAQPLYVPGVKIPGKGTHNVVYVATEHDQVYAFDADGLTSQPLWHDSFINPAQGITTVSTQKSPCPSLKPEAGITSTPVIDQASGTLYVSAETDEKGTVVQHLHGLDIATGSEKFGGPVVVQASFNGVTFDPTEIQRPGLLLENGNVYLAYASLCDPHPYHGWLLGYNAQNLQQQTATFVTTPNGNKGGIWQSGAGLASDGKSIYFMDGDGTFDAHTGGIDYGMSMMRMSIKGTGLTVADYFTPFDWAQRSAKDLDLGSGGVLLLPTQSGAHPDEIIGADKSGDIFVVDRQHMGKFHAKSNDVVQQLHGTVGGYRSSPAYWQQSIYYAGVNDYLSMYTITDGMLSSKPVSTSSTTFPSPGSSPSVSSNAASTGIVWILQISTGGGPAILRAYDATNLSKELYDSNQAGSRDQPGRGTKFAVPTIANGKVYIATQTELDAYGLLP
jgi:hypothetical protein